jgi:hypothetical protein
MMGRYERGIMSSLQDKLAAANAEIERLRNRLRTVKRAGAERQHPRPTLRPGWKGHTTAGNCIGPPRSRPVAGTIGRTPTTTA